MIFMVNIPLFLFFAIGCILPTLRFPEWSFSTSFTITSNQFLSFYVQTLSIHFILSLIYLSFRFCWILYFVLTSLFICITFLCSLLFHSQDVNTWLDFGVQSKNQKNAQVFKSVTCNYYLPLYFDICHSFKHRKKNLLFIYILIFRSCSNWTFTGIR